MTHRILLLDDEETIRTVMTAMLRKAGYEAVAVANGAEAFQQLSEARFDLLICDINLGDEDGLEILEQVKAQHPNLPVIMLTGLGFDEDLVQEAIQRKASGYVSKMLAPAQLVMEIRRVLKPGDNGDGARPG